MVVDDELSMREVLEMMLTKEGYQVTCAENGRKAIGLLEKNQYDLMLCDIRLGDISGLDVLQASKKMQPGYGRHPDFGICQHRNRRGGHERGSV